MLRFGLPAALLCLMFPGAVGAHNCRCLYSGGLVEQGRTACIKTAKGYELARCEMVLNNSSWKVLGRPCDRLESRKPVRTPASG